MLGDTSSYLSGDDTSKLVTPSEACCRKKQSDDTVRPAANPPETPPFPFTPAFYQMEGRRGGAESVKRDAVVHRDVAQAGPPAGDAQLHHSARLSRRQKDGIGKHQGRRINLSLIKNKWRRLLSRSMNDVQCTNRSQINKNKQTRQTYKNWEGFSQCSFLQE